MLYCIKHGGWYSMSKENTAVFIGHNECYGVTSEQIKGAIVSLIDKGVTDFLSGGQGGFDRLCGRCVYEVKKQYLHTPRVSVSAFPPSSLCRASRNFCRFQLV